jgi:diadenosine tetraphosphate (Ap4A) HIT family hydrolase
VDCPECVLVRAGATPLGAPVLRRGPFVVHAAPETFPVPGWLFVAPARHVEQVDALDAVERAALGPLVAEVAAALRAETPCEKVYVSVFAEVLHHCHVHVVARPPDLPANERGPRLFASERRADPAEALAIARRVHDRLAAPRPPGRISPVLLSGLVWPGLGQLATGHRLKGLLIVLGTLAAFGALLVRVADETLRRLPTDPADFDLYGIFEMARAIRQDNAAFFTGISAVLVGLWALAVADAWRDGRRRSAKTRPTA